MNCGAWRIWARSTVSRNIGAPRCGKWRKRLMMICSIAELWGAQARSVELTAELQSLTDLGYRLLREKMNATVPCGKLPDGAGWQPALPRIRDRRCPE